MTNVWFYQPEIFRQRPEPGCIVTALPAATVEPLVEDFPGMMKVIMQTLVVAPDTIVLPVSPQLSVQFCKQHRFRQVAMVFTPRLEIG
jgi:hypothetical protein